MEVQTWEETEEYDNLIHDAWTIAYSAKGHNLDDWYFSMAAHEEAKEGDTVEDLVIKIWEYYGYSWKSGNLKSATISYSDYNDI